MAVRSDGRAGRLASAPAASSLGLCAVLCAWRACVPYRLLIARWWPFAVGCRTSGANAGRCAGRPVGLAERPSGLCAAAATKSEASESPAAAGKIGSNSQVGPAHFRPGPVRRGALGAQRAAPSGNKPAGPPASATPRSGGRAHGEPDGPPLSRRAARQCASAGPSGAAKILPAQTANRRARLAFLRAAKRASGHARLVWISASAAASPACPASLAGLTRWPSGKRASLASERATGRLSAALREERERARSPACLAVRRDPAVATRHLLPLLILGEPAGGDSAARWPICGVAGAKLAGGRSMAIAIVSSRAPGICKARRKRPQAALAC